VVIAMQGGALQLQGGACNAMVPAIGVCNAILGMVIAIATHRTISYNQIQ